MRVHKEGFSREIQRLISIHYWNEPDEPRCVAVIRTTFNKGSYEWHREETISVSLSEVTKIKGGQEAVNKFRVTLPERMERIYFSD